MTRGEAIIALAREYAEWGDPDALPYEQRYRVMAIRLALESAAEKLDIYGLAEKAQRLDAARIQYEDAESDYRAALIDGTALRRAERRFVQIKREVVRA